MYKIFFFIADRINSFVPFIRSLCLHTLLDRSTCDIEGLHQPSRITHSSSFLSLSSCFDLLSSVCVCVTRKQSLTIASLHHSGAYKGLLFHYLHSPEKLIDDDVKSDISNSIKSEARMSSRDSRKQMKNGNTRLSY